jgi:hypothetical protein
VRLVTSIVTPGIAPPDVSLARPVMAPVACAASDAVIESTSRMKAEAMRMRRS